MVKRFFAMLRMTDVGGCGIAIAYKDLSGSKPINYKEYYASLTFNGNTRFPKDVAMPNDLSPAQLINLGKDPGLGVGGLHKSGITGEGVNVAIIDDTVLKSHMEFKYNIANYKSFGNASAYDSQSGAMSAGALVGKNTGTAPGANLYYAAVPYQSDDADCYIKALDWLLEQSESLPKGKQIRVVAVAPNPALCVQNAKGWCDAVKRAEAHGMLVLDGNNSGDGFIASGFFDVFKRNDVSTMQGGSPFIPSNQPLSSVLFVPASGVTVVSPNYQGSPSEEYEYLGSNGTIGFAQAYAAGICAMGWQIHPEYTAQQMVDLLFETAYINPNDRLRANHFICPQRFINELQARQ